MRISIIVAMDRSGVIGNDHGLPWHLPRDLRRFRDLTMGKPIVMGRTTHEHIGRPLPGRQNFVLTRKPGLTLTGCIVARSLEEVFDTAAPETDEVFVIGGRQLYREAIPKAQRIYLTLVEGKFSGTTYFPCELLRPEEWKETRRELFESDETNKYRHLFLVLDRIQPGEARPFDLAATLAEPLVGAE
jgi:dihydrofolate reductase